MIRSKILRLGFLFCLSILILYPPTLAIAQTGYLSVRATPEPVQIIIDGREMQDATHVGGTYELTPGTHTVRAEKKYYVSQSQRVQVQVGQVSTIIIKMFESTSFHTKKYDESSLGKGYGSLDEIERMCQEELEYQRRMRQEELEFERKKFREVLEYQHRMRQEELEFVRKKNEMEGKRQEEKRKELEKQGLILENREGEIGRKRQEELEPARKESEHEAMKAGNESEKAEASEKAEEIEEIKETSAVDYKALGLSSVELNPNDYPDEVIALLEPHKDNENNNSVLFYSSLGLAYKCKGRLKDAIAAYKRALEIAPNASAIQYNLGIAYFYHNELSKSFKYLLKSSEQRPDHSGTKKWIKHLAGELNIFNIPDTSKLKLVVNRKMSVNRKKPDRESRIRIYLTQDGGRIQELSVNDKIYSYGIDSDTERPVDYIIIDNDGDGNFDKVINTKGKFGVPTWAYNPD